MIRVAPGEKVRPAHSHPHGEEVIYIIRGTGRVLVAGEVAQVREGSTVLFPQGAVHMLHNTGREEMKVICFFAPGTNLDNYKFYETVPRLWGVSALDDMRFAGLIMKIVVGFSLWITITVVFFRWYNAEQTGSPARRVSRDLDRELLELQQR